MRDTVFLHSNGGTYDGYCRDAICACHNATFGQTYVTVKKEQVTDLDGYIVSAPKTATKHDQGKLDWTLLPFKALEGPVRVLMFGAKKYDRDNWRKGLDRKQTIGATIRHLVAYLEESQIDPETGESHLAHAVCELLFQIEFDRLGLHEPIDHTKFEPK